MCCMYTSFSIVMYRWPSPSALNKSEVPGLVGVSFGDDWCEVGIAVHWMHVFPCLSYNTALVAAYFAELWAYSTSLWPVSEFQFIIIIELLYAHCWGWCRECGRGILIWAAILGFGHWLICCMFLWNIDLYGFPQYSTFRG